jgi:hypothetical protein
MTEVGEGFTQTIQLTSDSFSTVFAPTGETRKITMVYAKRQDFGKPVNTKITLAPASGAEATANGGTRYEKFSSSNVDVDRIPLLGGNVRMFDDAQSLAGLQPIIIDDSDGLYVSQFADSVDGSNPNPVPLDLIVQGVRIA